ncbi:MAG: MBL fold metallo-hydrolase [Anaerolineae bacterium]|nr:MBL fold metallo-hydrolase [Anaerolineae bacterium]
MELKHIVDHVYYLAGVINIGVIRGDDDQVVLIDSGIGDRSARQILRLLQAQGWRPVAVCNTHGHGDHVGGNAYLVEQAGVRVYAPLYDSTVIQQPIWGRLFMFAGAEPIREIAAPRFSARPSPVHEVVMEGALSIAGTTVEAITMPGHTGTHTCYRAGKVLFLGDLLAGEVELEHVKIPYAYSVGMRLESLERLRTIEADYYLLAHGSLYRDIVPLLERNIARVHETLDFIRKYLSRGRAGATDIVAAVADHFGLNINRIRDYFMFHPTIYSHLSYLHSRGEIDFELEGNRLWWKWNVG